MSFQGSRELKYYSRLNIYKNSTDSCSYNPETYTGYSYAEKIINTCKIGKKTYKLFNYYSFSNTTNGHQSALRGYFGDIPLDGLTISVYSLNNIYDKKSLKEVLYKCIDEYNLEVVLEIFGEKEAAKYKKAIDQKEVDRKLAAKFHRMETKLKSLDYSEKNIIAKAHEYIKGAAPYSIYFTDSGLSSTQLFKLQLLNNSEKVRPFFEGKRFETITRNFQAAIAAKNSGLDIYYTSKTIGLSNIEQWTTTIEKMGITEAAALIDMDLKFSDNHSEWRHGGVVPIKQVAEFKALSDKLNFEISISDDRQKELDNYNNLSGLFSA